MEGHLNHPRPHHHPRQLLHHPQQQYITTINFGTTSPIDSRFPQWSIQETKEFLMIRSQLDRTFMETKRNKLLWEVISSQMKEKGFIRSPEQCKCKWKNLVTRYKGCETIEDEATKQQYPYYNELQAIFGARMERMLWVEAEGEGGASGSKKKVERLHFLSSEDEDDNDGSNKDKVRVSSKKKRKGKTSVIVTPNMMNTGNNDSLREILNEYMKQQMAMEMKWRVAFEVRAKERMMKEMEWRKIMEGLEKERILMDKRWREREEEWRIKDESRSQKRDALVTMLLNMLRRQDHHGTM